MDGTARPRVVVVEDDRDVATLVTEVLNDEGFEAVTADRRASAAEVRRMRPQVVIVDLHLGHAGAHEFVAALHEHGSLRVPVVLMSAAQDVEEQARSLGANAFLTKPFDIDALVRTCRGLSAA